MTKLTTRAALLTLIPSALLASASFVVATVLKLFETDSGRGALYTFILGWSLFICFNLLHQLWTVMRSTGPLIPFAVSARIALFLIAFIPVPAAWFALPFVSDIRGWSAPLFVYLGGATTIGICWWYVWSMRHLRKTFQRIRAGLPTCHYCGYDLTANQSNRCPECGEPTQAAA